MKILILGADGYLGWPTTLHFADQGHEVITVDDYSKRDLLGFHNCKSLISTSSIRERLRNLSDFENRRSLAVSFECCNIAKEPDDLLRIIMQAGPDVIIHYAEQPSAPYSMSSLEAAAYTIQNNALSTLNLIHAVRDAGQEKTCHIIKFGSMGEYGTPNIVIEEGWLDVEHRGRKDQFLYPRAPGSLYHVTKVADTDMLWFYCKQWGLRVTDVMQGVVYGVSTPEIDKYKMPTNFYYDEMFGTVINRFIVQAIIGHPLTVYGSGRQQRTFLNLKDVLCCLDLIIEHPPEPSKMEIINQFSEQTSILALARLVKNEARALGLNTEINNHLGNLRQEKQDHWYWPRKDKLDNWGLKPHYMVNGEIKEMFERLLPFKDRINRGIIYKGIKWNE